MDGGRTSQILEAAGADGLLSSLPGEFTMGDGIPDANAVLQTVNGERVLSRLWESALAGSTGAFRLTGRLCGVLVLFAVWTRYRKAVHGGVDLFSRTVTLVLSLIGFGALTDLFADTADYFSQLHTAVTAALTTLTALSAMRGAVQTAALGSMGMALFLAVMETVCASVLFPFLRLCAGMSLVSAVGDTDAPAQISGLLRRQFLWIVGGVMTLLCAVLSYQSVLARAADSVAMRAVKFTLSGAVPIIGGAVGEAAAAVAAGFSLAQKTVGVLGIAAILWQILPTVCSVALVRGAFSVSAMAAALLGMKTEEGVLSECASLCGFLLAVCIAAAVFYILMLTLCMNGGG